MYNSNLYQEYQTSVGVKEVEKNNELLTQGDSDKISQIEENISENPKQKLTAKQKIALLEEKKKKLEARMQAVKAAEKKEETRRKILIGAAILAIVENSEDDRITEDDLMGIMDTFLSRDNDRKLFNLDPIAK